MFWQGFVFALGFRLGSMAFAFIAAATCMAVEKVWTSFQKLRRRSGVIEIGVWRRTYSYADLLVPEIPSRRNMDKGGSPNGRGTATEHFETI